MLKPKETATREIVPLDGLWRFDIDRPELGEPWKQPLQTTLEAAVPASYNDLFVDATIRDHVGWVWYERTVRVPRSWGSERVLLRFDAATHEAGVYVDGSYVGGHVGGYTPFEIDVTDHVVAGSEFRLTVGVNNQLTNETIPPGKLGTSMSGKKTQKYLHDFYNYAGLARSVRLVSIPATAIEDITVRTDLDGFDAKVHYDVDVAGDAHDVSVRVRAVDADGNTVAEASGDHGTLQISGATLWKPGAGYLYELIVDLVDGDAVLDTYPQTFGIRTVEVRGTEFLINGEPFYFTGFGKHEDTAVRGKGHDDAYLVHDFQLIEWIGANSFRTSHYPYAEEVYDYADRHGIVVIDEAAAVGLNLGVEGGLAGAPSTPTFSAETCNDASREALMQHVRELITRDKNHPSVVMWCLTNEPASNEDGAREYFEPIVELARELDPTRPLTYALVMFASTENDKIVDLFDVISLNRYYGWYVATGDLETAETYLTMDLQGWVDAYQKPIMMTEYGADTEPGLHSIWDRPWTEEYQRDYLDMHHRVFDKFPQFVGEQVWNFADFQTSLGIHRVDGNKKGVFTRDRKPKAAAHTLRTRWREIGQHKPTRQGDAHE